MASTSGQGFNSSRIYNWLGENFDGHETIEDDLSNNLNGNDDIIKPSVESLPLSLEPLEPYIGMEFESAEDAREFYEMYGRSAGFTIRNNRTRRLLKDNSIIGREFVCSKEGFRADKYANRENRILPSRPATREGCNAMLRIAAKDGGKWVIYGFVKEHNHELNPSKIPPRRSHRIAFCEDGVKVSLLSVGLPKLEVVEGILISMDPLAEMNREILEPNFYKIFVQIVKKLKALLERPYQGIRIVEESVSRHVAWKSVDVIEKE